MRGGAKLGTMPSWQGGVARFNKDDDDTNNNDNNNNNNDSSDDDNDDGD